MDNTSDIDDGFGGSTGACPEDTLHRDQEDSEPVVWLREFAKIGPGPQVKVTYYFEFYGIEIQVNSMMYNGIPLMDCDIQRIEKRSL